MNVIKKKMRLFLKTYFKNFNHGKNIEVSDTSLSSLEEKSGRKKVHCIGSGGKIN